MKTDVKRKWIEALRRGKYKQTQNVLKRENKDGTFSYCCLGVLCETEGVESIPTDYSNFIYEFVDAMNDAPAVGCLPISLAKKINLTMDIQYDLIQLNDNKRCNFKEIASWIEQNIPDDKEE